MKNKSIVIGLFADRIDILSCVGGHVAASRRIEYTLGTEPQDWRKAIGDASKVVQTASRELGAVGASATVLYRNPTACADFSSVSIKSSAQATESATLGCGDALTCSQDEAVTAAAIVARDNTGKEPQTHVVVAADHEDIVNAIAIMVEAAGLKFEGASPIDAVVMAHFATQVHKKATKTSSYLYVGESRSFFIIAEQGRLLFARPINLGTDALTTSLTRPVRTAKSEEPVELSHAVSQGILFQHGFPSRNQVVHEELNLTGSHVIPLLQPILQRFIVELRQSLRFGVVEEQRQELALTITGPGSAIPNFASLLASELRLTVQADESHTAFDFRTPDSCGSELMDAIEDPRTLAQLTLLPRRIAEARNSRRLRRCLLSGAAAALALTGVDTLLYQNRLETARAELATMQSQATDLQTLKATGEKLFATIGAMDKLESTIAKEMGFPTNIRALMQEVSRIMPEPEGSVQLTGISLNLDKTKTLGRITGYAFEGNGAVRSQLEPFIANLKQSPLFDEVVLFNVRTASITQMTAQQFEVNMLVVGVPYTPPAAVATAVTSATGGANP